MLRKSAESCDRRWQACRGEDIRHDARGAPGRSADGNPRLQVQRRSALARPQCPPQPFVAHRWQQIRRLLFADEAPVAQFGAGKQQAPDRGVVEPAAVEEEAQAAEAGRRGRLPVDDEQSGYVVQLQAGLLGDLAYARARGASPDSTTPPGNSQPALYVGSTSSTRSCSSKSSTPAATVSAVGSGVCTISQTGASPVCTASAMRSAASYGVSAPVSTGWASARSQEASAARYGSMWS